MAGQGQHRVYGGLPTTGLDHHELPREEGQGVGGAAKGGGEQHARRGAEHNHDHLRKKKV